MRKWKKTLFETDEAGRRFQSQDANYSNHAPVGNKDYADGLDQNKEQFFLQYFQGRYSSDISRYAIWDNYLRRHLKRGDEIFSVASGPCINELRLINDGFSIEKQQSPQWA